MAAVATMISTTPQGAHMHTQPTQAAGPTCQAPAAAGEASYQGIHGILHLQAAAAQDTVRTSITPPADTPHQHKTPPTLPPPPAPRGGGTWGKRS